jgi:hypothetical protein
VWLVRNSPLGHQLKSLTSRFSARACDPSEYALVAGVGVQLPLGHARPGAHESSGSFSAVRSRTSCSIAWAASTGSSCSGILTTSQPAAASWVVGVAVAAGDATDFRRHQLVLVLGRWLWSAQVCQKQPSTNGAILASRSKMSTRRRRFPTKSAPSMSPSSGAASVDDARHRHDPTGRLRNRRLRDGRRSWSGSGRARRCRESREHSRQIIIVVERVLTRAHDHDETRRRRSTPSPAAHITPAR